MSIFELIFLAIILYYIVYIILWIVLDCNVEVYFKQHFGAAISSMRGQVVWVTGASSGIGSALAIHLAKHGVKLAISARRVQHLDEVRAECLKQAGGLLSANDVLVLPMDMLDMASHEKCFKTVLEHFGHVDVLVNNAGRSQRAAWEEIAVQVDRDLFELDVFAVMNLSRIVVRYFIQQCGGRGHIAATSSVAGFVVVPNSATYCAAKHALNAYLRALHFEHPLIDVTIFAPGPVATDFLKDAFTGVPDAKCGQSTKDQRRLTPDRCGHLFAVALANKLQLTWCGLFPVNFLAYASRSVILSKILERVMTGGTVSKIREGKL